MTDALSDQTRDETIANPRVRLKKAAKALGNSGDAQAAITAWREYLLVADDDAESHRRLAQLLTRNGQPAESVAHWRKAIDADPSDSDLLRRFAPVLGDTGDAEGEVAVLLRLLELEREDVVVRARLVRLLAELGREQEAIPHLEVMVRFDAASEEAKHWRTLAKAVVGAPEAEIEALRKVRKAVANRRELLTPLDRYIFTLHGRTGVEQAHSVRRIRRFAELNGGRSYLEIGVSKGNTFHALDFPRKVAVDPLFRFDVEQHARAGVDFFEVPSDEYFEKFPPQEAFDVIFLDGLHVFEQTWRDFTNSLKCSHDRTIWLIDDVLPCDEFSALPDPEECSRLRLEIGSPVHKWHGDIYKTMFAIHDFCPDYSFLSINSNGNGQGVVWRQPRRDVAPVLGSMEAVQTLDYFGMQRLESVMNFCSEEEAMDILQAAFTGRS